MASNRRVVDMTGRDTAQDEGSPAHERLTDIAGWTYSREFISAFSDADAGSKPPEGRLEYLRQAETFVGKTTAQGLELWFAGSSVESSSGVADWAAALSKVPLQ